MSKDINDGGPAFPRDDFGDGIPGMSLRDWFAGQALAGLCATDRANQYPFGETALDAYRIADAMLKAREEGR